jgi:hypothetical protein
MAGRSIEHRLTRRLWGVESQLLEFLASHNKEEFMSFISERYIGTYEGHTIELVRNNLDKTLKLLIDKQEVASESRILPHDISLTGTLEHNGKKHTVVAKSIVRFPSTEDTIEIDGQTLPLMKMK